MGIVLNVKTIQTHSQFWSNGSQKSGTQDKRSVRKASNQGLLLSFLNYLFFSPGLFVYGRVIMLTFRKYIYPSIFLKRFKFCLIVV